MKTPLGYQCTELDCVPTTITNGIRYLFNRNEIHPEVVKIINLYSLDTKDKNGKVGGKGTSLYSIQLISNSLNQISDFQLKCELLLKDEVKLDTISNCIEDNGVVAVRVYYGDSLYHYILVTNIDEKNVYVFDPYYRKKKYEDQEIELIENESVKYNRKIAKERFASEELKIFAMSKVEERECILMGKIC
ncbi:MULTISPECIES: hypothetical protein [Clostridium]|uniref:hypothetical protein n=1 Tax=Clostridium TaxID=1485 RepID=UPI001494C76A|nr:MULTISPECIES: hypothetical protein [Clostridium]NOW91073.1 hypothetical protein [Clostridium beijerinckii]